MDHVNAHNNHDFYVRIHQKISKSFAEWFERTENIRHAVKEIEVNSLYEIFLRIIHISSTHM